VPLSKTPYLLLKLESPKALYLLRTLEPLAQPPPLRVLRVFGGCLTTTRRLKSRPTLKLLIKSFSYCCYSLITFQPGICPHFLLSTKLARNQKKRMDRSRTYLVGRSDKAEAEKKTPGHGSL
jgi:hypothetical protein